MENLHDQIDDAPPGPTGKAGEAVGFKRQTGMMIAVKRTQGPPMPVNCHPVKAGSRHNIGFFPDDVKD